MIVQLNTGKAELLFVKLNDYYNDYYDLIITEAGNIYGINPTTHEQNQITCDIDLRKFELIGLANELTEKQCVEIMECIGEDPMNALVLMYSCGKNAFFTAKESFKSLMDKHEIYMVNPVIKPEYKPISDITTIMTIDYYNTAIAKWQKAEERTGKWLVLKKQ